MLCESEVAYYHPIFGHIAYEWSTTSATQCRKGHRHITHRKVLSCGGVPKIETSSCFWESYVCPG